MALKGSLRDFGVSEILQLISLQKKSGLLKLKGADKMIRLLIDRGKIVEVESEPEEESEQLTSYLVNSGLISRVKMVEAEKRSRQELKPLEAVLLQSQLISVQDLQEMIKLRNFDLLFELFLWREGEYEFETGAVSFTPQYCVPMDIEKILMDGYRIKDEWALISKEITSMNAVFEKAQADFSIEEKLLEDEEKIYSLIDGNRTVREICYLSKMGKFETCKCLAELLRRGKILEVVSIPSAKRANSAKEAVQAFPGQKWFEYSFYSALVIFLILLLNGIRMNVGWAFPRVASHPLHKTLNLWQLNRIELGLEAYRLINSDYPDSLNSLVPDWFKKGDLHFPYRLGYYYSKDAYGYQLKTPLLDEGGE